MLGTLLHIICYDVWFYLSHLILHSPNVYFIHKLHHLKQHDQLTWQDTNVSHLIEHIVQPVGIFVPCFFPGFSLKSLLIAYVFIAVRGLMRHDNRCVWLIGNHHILHHKYRNYNYGEYWIDTLCGTKCPYENEYVYGIIYQ